MEVTDDAVATDYEAAVDAFIEAEKNWKAMEELVTSGKFMEEIFANAAGNPARAILEWQQLWNCLKTVQEEFNVKRRNAADALRQAVVLTPNQWRGPDGDATTFSYKGFKVTSITKRSFDADSLFAMMRQRGLLDRLLSLKVLNKEGIEVPVVNQQWVINYDALTNWLKANKLDDVLIGSYDEHESTPQVKGPKEVAFLGDIKKAD